MVALVSSLGAEVEEAVATNPFDSLYVTETIDPVSFVTVFSPLLVHDTSALFRPGNVVLVGTQGSGKSMLLTLLKPETRIAFADAGVDFPLDGSAPPFVGAGINLTRSGAIDFGQRPIESGPESFGLLEAHFADFLNYWIVRDLMRSVCLLAKNRRPGVTLNAESKRLDEFAVDLAAADTWSGALRDVGSFEQLRSLLNQRVRAYRDFLNFNSAMLPDVIGDTKTSAGEPISVAAEFLRSHDVLDSSTEIYIRIDQYEELGRLAELQADAVGEYETVVHKMLGLRDPRVSYRIGTRRHAWPDRPRMQGTAAVLEEMRNYKPVDLDELLRRREHSPGLFGRFADDVFRRRLQWAGYECPPGRGRCTTAVFGETLPPRDEALLYVKEGRSVEVDLLEVGSGTQRVIAELWAQDPLAARLGEAWIAQKGDPGLATSSGPFPWDKREWWKKERIPQALLQIAARHRQRMIFSGEKDVIALAGSNILAFVSLCQSIWDAWLRNPMADPRIETLPSIPRPYIQDEGIHQASAYWYRKIRSDRDGDGRQRFIGLLGRLFRDWLRSDVSMSNPGHNGFSIVMDDLDSDPEVKRILEEASSFGVLVDRQHTNRNRGGGRRVKWYLSSIYCPYFQIPVSHVKEPRYVTASEVRDWLVEVKMLKGSPGPKRTDSHPTLFE